MYTILFFYSVLCTTLVNTFNFKLMKFRYTIIIKHSKPKAYITLGTSPYNVYILFYLI